MHNLWCGKPCSDCTSPCVFDYETPCSLDCPLLGKNGERSDSLCAAAGCDAYERTDEDGNHRKTVSTKTKTFVKLKEAMS